jgi:coenzyme F420-reducing hydrogenase delta subunit
MSGQGHSTDALYRLNDQDFEPEVVAFCCHYCAYAAADLAGSMRLDYPTSIKVIEMPCSGKVDPLYLLRAFEDGADGVMVAG